MANSASSTSALAIVEPGRRSLNVRLIALPRIAHTRNPTT